MSVTIGVAPSGVGTRLHIPGLAGRPGVVVRPIALPRIDPLHDGIRAGNLSGLEGIDLFIVGTPPYCHVSHSELLLRSGIPVLCEKPVGLNANQTTQIAAVAKAMKLECRVNFQLRFHPVVRQARMTALARNPADIHITCTSNARRSRVGKPTWYWDQTAGGGVWFSLLPHLIDLAGFLGASIELAAIASAVPPSGPDRGIDVLKIHARCSGARNLTVIADPLSATSSFTIRLGYPQVADDVFDLRDGGPNPWLTAFSAYADVLLSGVAPLDLRDCATLDDAVNVHEVISAIRSLCARVNVLLLAVHPGTLAGNGRQGFQG